MKSLGERVKIIFTFKNIFIAVFSVVVVFVPQLLYWKFAYGKFISDSYPGETFAFLAHPKIGEFLFSPHNGLISYSPLYLVLMALSLIMCYYKRLMYISIILSCILLIYLSSAWYLFYFGCGFSARNFVEFSPIFAFPFADFIQSKYNKILKSLTYLIIIICIGINIKLMASWDVCFWGTNDWDWREYKYLLYQNPKTLQQNLDTLSPEKVKIFDNEIAYKIDSLELFSPGINFYPNQLTSGYFKHASINVEVMPLSKTSVAQLACMGFNNDSTLFYNAIKIEGAINKWNKVRFNSNLPFHASKNYLIKVFIMNPNKEQYLMKNLRIDLN